MRRPPRRVFTALNLAAVALVGLLDWVMPAGIVVGLLLGVPIVLSSTADDVREVWLTTGLAWAAFILAAIYGSGPVSPAQVWVPNRVVAFVSLLAFGAIATMLQRRRKQAVQARDEALRASALSRLLTSLLAHDLRSPLLLAIGAMEYLDRGESQSDPGLIADVRARLSRNLRTVDDLLGMARSEVNRSTATSAQPIDAAELGGAVAAEVRSFEPEARGHGHTLVLDPPHLGDGPYHVDATILRRMLSILLDNAVRHARPGTVTVSVAAAHGSLDIRVSDAGPAGGPSAGGSGLGLQLCRSLAEYSGGRLESRFGQEGAELRLTLPTTRRGATTSGAASG